MEVKGSTVLVTGASSGIGAALARQLARRGAVVGLVARRGDRLAQVLEECRNSSPDSQMWVVDLGDLDAAEKLTSEAWKAFGHLDVLVNNAGVPMRRHTTRLDPQTLDWVMRVNFFAPARMSMALIPRMIERGSGMIVNVSSVAGRLGNANEAAYSASKFALCGWSEAIAVDLWDTGIKVRLVNPGPIDTEIWDLPENDEPLYHGAKISPDEAALAILGAIEGDKFEQYVPDMKSIIESKTSDPDAFIEGMASMLRTGQ